MLRQTPFLSFPYDVQFKSLISLSKAIDFPAENVVSLQQHQNCYKPWRTLTPLLWRFFIFLSFPHSTKQYAGYGVVSSKRLPYGSQNSAYSLWEYASNRKHCLRLARGEKSGHFSTLKNEPGLCLQGNFPWPLAMLRKRSVLQMPETADSS